MAHRKRATNRNRHQEQQTDEKATPAKEQKGPVSQAPQGAPLDNAGG